MKKKTAVGYVRISTEDQSQFSIPNQKEQIIQFCKRNDYELSKIFVDEGQSAKSFDRKAWKELDKHMRANQGNINYLVVFKYDRFSRNLVEALTVIENLEKIYNVTLLSVNEFINLPTESPFYFQIRTSMLLNAHHERLVIRDRTMSGMRKAMGEGYYMGKAPYGYTNSRNEYGKPTLVINEEKAFIVSKIFEWYENGYSLTDILNQAKEIGFNQNGNSAVKRILTNRVYAGQVNKNMKSEDPIWITGKHHPLIDLNRFEKIQWQLRKPQMHIEPNHICYLKSAIVCHQCGRPMTVCRSKGRNAYYWYYECTTHRKANPVAKAHDKFNQILDEITFSNKQIDYIKEYVTQQINDHIASNLGRLPSVESKRAGQMKMLRNLEEKYLQGMIDDNSFLEWKRELKAEISKLSNEIKLLSKTKTAYADTILSEFDKLKTIRTAFEHADFNQKRTFIEIGFGRGLSWDGEVYRTAYLNPIFITKQLKLRQKNILFFEPKKAENRSFPLSTPNEFIAEPIELLFNWLKTAQAG